MTRLSVNVNKIATLRNSRGGDVPNLKKIALDCERFGAQGITVHPRPDERHIRYSDVYELAPLIRTEFNIEGYPDEKFLNMLAKVKPAQATLVPDPPEVLTSNAGWLVKANEAFLSPVVARLKESGIRVSLFIDPKTAREQDFATMKNMGVDRIELYTEAYAKAYPTPKRETVTAPYIESAKTAQKFGLGVNAGHDLNTENLSYLIAQIPWIAEVSIGHALISDALYWGLEETIRRYLACLQS